MVKFDRAGIEELARSENRDKSGLVVLYAPWCSFSQVRRLPEKFTSALLVHFYVARLISDCTF